MNVAVGQTITVKFPFYVEQIVKHEISGESYPEEAWVPGCKDEFVYPDDSELVANGVGEMILDVVDIHKPGTYPERVFYTRRWVDPDGNEFSSGRLQITTIPTFKKRAAGYYYPYRVI